MITKNSQRFAQLTVIVATLVALPACWPCGCSSDKKQQEQTQENAAAQKTDLVVMNVLDKDLYEDCHIKGSVNVPLDQVEHFVAGLDKENADIVVYCSNYQCTASESVAKKLQELGCKKVAVYEGGMAEWYQQHRACEGSCNLEKSTYLAHKVEQAPVEHRDINVITAEQLEQKLAQVSA
jgi:rhodanese-related sulfurtransferase